MARPLQTGKQSVNLATPEVRVSRIRRDPPPPTAVKELVVRDREGRDARTVVLGVATFAVTLFLLAIGVSNAIGWSPTQYTVGSEGRE